MTLREAVEAALKAYNPDQPRDEDGQWTDDNSRPKVKVAKPIKRGRYGEFQIKNGKLLMARLGPMNPIKQKHFAASYKPDDPMGMAGYNKPPVSRGFWASPFGHDDSFLYYHRYEALLPKRFQRGSKEYESIVNAPPEDSVTYGVTRNGKYERVTYARPSPAQQAKIDAFFAEREAALKKIEKREKVKLFWHGGQFYSHIPPPYVKDRTQSWYLWDNAAEWAEQAKKFMFHVWRDQTGKPHVSPYDRQQLEIFVPGVAE